jgi:3-oxoacyl-[acyl-carrier protein] reductase
MTSKTDEGVKKLAQGEKTAFVSGAGRNIGRAIALEMARRGCNVVVNGHTNREICERVAEEVRAAGVEALVAVGDVGSSDEVRRMAAEALGQFGAVDIVVNNAAIRPAKPFLDMTDEDWHRVLDVDLNAAFYTGRAFAGGMVDKGWGRIVNVTGMNAMHGYSGRAPVSAAKHGLWGLTKSMAKEFGPKGVTVNAISPGPIRSDHPDPEMTRHIESHLPNVPVGRLGEPHDIAAMCGLLCSDEGGFVNGQMIAVNGGMQT